MKRDSIFWGVVLIVVGVLLYLQSQGIVRNVFQYFGPLALILVGAWIILGVYWKPTPSAGETFSIPLGAAQSVHYHFSHGAGQLELGSGAPAGQALSGTYASGMNHKSQLSGDRLDIRVEAGPSFIPFLGPGEGVWRFQLAPGIPSLLTVESGASALNFDLRDLLISRFVLKTGASSAHVTLPARGASILDVEAGAASINIRVPDGTAARIRVREGVTAVDVDTARFARLETGFYQSSGYDTSSDRAEINIESGLGKVSVA